jgi:hypothetical protein
MAEPLVNLGERIVRAARLAAMIHLHESVAEQLINGRRISIGQAGVDRVTEDPSSDASLRILRGDFYADGGAE